MPNDSHVTAAPRACHATLDFAARPHSARPHPHCLPLINRPKSWPIRAELGRMSDLIHAVGIVLALPH